jgi:hypothetical protein
MSARASKVHLWALLRRERSRPDRDGGGLKSDRVDLPETGGFPLMA